MDSLNKIILQEIKNGKKSGSFCAFIRKHVSDYSLSTSPAELFCLSLQSVSALKAGKMV